MTAVELLARVATTANPADPPQSARPAFACGGGFA